MAEWKIFYTDGTSLLHSEVESVHDIPSGKRIGVHSVIQPFQKNTMREVLEASYYLFMSSTQSWVMCGNDGLLDHLIVSFNDIECVLHGRAQSTDEFWSLKNAIRRDTDIICAIDSPRSQFDLGSVFQPSLYWRWAERLGDANDRVR